MVFLLICLVAARQSPAPAPPGYQNLRHHEDWSVFRDRPAEGFWGPLKFVPLNDEGGAWASFGGQLRGRTELWSDFAFEEDSDDAYSLLRARVHGDFHFGPRFRLFLEGKSSLATGRELPGGTRTVDADTAALQSAFIDLRAPLENGSITLRAGRQELQFGRQRLVSPLDWSNTRPRIFDGFNAIVRTGSWKMDGFWSRFVRVDKYGLNDHAAGVDFFGVYAAGELAGGERGLDLYWLGIDRETANETRHTLGGRFFGTFADGDGDFELESAYQFGDSDGADIGAFLFASRFGYGFSSAARTPDIHLGFEYASGDDDPRDRHRGTFDPLFPLGHAYLGFIDIVGFRNIIDLSHGFGLRLRHHMRLSLDHHLFWRARAGDALYNAGGAAVRDGSPGTSRFVGNELDLTWNLRVNPHLVAVAGYSHFFAGRFIEESGADRDTDFAYLMFVYTF